MTLTLTLTLQDRRALYFWLLDSTIVDGYTLPEVLAIYKATNEAGLTR